MEGTTRGRRLLKWTAQILHLRGTTQEVLTEGKTN